MEPTTEHKYYTRRGDWVSKPSITAGEAVAFLEAIKDQVSDGPSRVNKGLPAWVAWQIFHKAAKAIDPTHAIHALVFKNIKKEFGHLEVRRP